MVGMHISIAFNYPLESMAMAWAEWMVPNLSLEGEYQVERACRLLRSDGNKHVDRVVNLACDLVRHNAIQSVLLKQALGHIAQIECQLALHDTERGITAEHLQWAADLNAGKEP